MYIDYETLNPEQVDRLEAFRDSYIPSIWEESEKEYASRHEGRKSFVIKASHGEVVGEWSEVSYF